ncbi:hypothetical protein LO762_05775 [Actinocorallia sp. API 0066]|uniref:hypothetical protein n=1 Tax=Actinocorallia sp. API 0066 TaxID=2896846 RepID=UPI001E4B07FF|nr:hypothetical protein [Actinocorallia sp. API 0066]MCD0448705.1 hypothetical protein [Actinocorallia sp. API 0066]
MTGAEGRELTAVEVAVVDAALVEELVDLLELPGELLSRYRARLEAGGRLTPRAEPEGAARGVSGARRP